MGEDGDPAMEAGMLIVIDVAKAELVPNQALAKTITTGGTFRIGKRPELTNQRKGLEEADDGQWAI